jgi:hypothetical protein
VFGWVGWLGVVREHSYCYSLVATDRDFSNCSQRGWRLSVLCYCKSTVERERERERVNDGLKQKELTNHGDDITNHQTSLTFVLFIKLAFLQLVMAK